MDAGLSSANAENYLYTALENMKNIGMKIPQVRLELVDDPGIQCAGWK